MARALVVDDERNIRDLVAMYLVAAGFDVDEADDGRIAIEMARQSPYDVVILDVMLPGADGAEVCRSIREASDVPVIMLTARDIESEKVALLEAGADDYVTKPFSPPELVARARAAVRRYRGSPDAEGGVLRAGGLVLDPAAHEVSVDGSSVTLTAREFAILHALMRQPGVVLSRQQILDAAWGFSDFVDERGVDVHIRHIREKIGDDAAEPRFIETIRGVGYRFKRDAR
ncbi:response regulator transcription factor [Coriobacteriia bacterium Es71-Z0120]|uniref:response regulator transcription factor n=1 Tax=Parvivirga hydrogeniphila TaxID=2939460 RepID=UPI0022609AAE|nr:response regulator transcription factor [Parvivirga hydrogeniphila]MCL4079522.1 response regulator transcription factor [Parvivirga hydrogeniphila]